VSKDIVLFAPRDGSIEVHPDAIRMRNEALEAGALVGRVNDEPTNAGATQALQAIKRVLNLCESTRKKVKEPVLDLARRIDQTAKDFSSDLQEEFRRISAACADYQTEQLERVKAQERARAEEAARIERERQEALRKIDQERQRAEEEVRRKAAAEAAAAKSKEEIDAAYARAQAEQQAIAEAAAAKAKAEDERRAQESQAVALPVAPTRAAGQSVKPTWQWEVTDIWTLARMHPGLVEITPRRQQINEVVESLATAGEPRIPGLRIWSEVRVGVRAQRERPTIEV